MSINVQLQILAGIIELEKQRNEARAEIVALRRQLEELQAANQWYRPSEKLPIDGIGMGNCIIPCFAYWRGAGSMYVEFWPCADGSRPEWKIAPQTPFASWRTPPVCWCYFPVPPANMREGQP